MPGLKRRRSLLLAGLFVAFAATASAQPLPAGTDSPVPATEHLSPDRVKIGRLGPAAGALEQPALDGLRQRAKGGGSLLGDIARDYREFFTSRETYAILGVGLGASAGLRPLDGPIARSRFNVELFPRPGMDAAFEAGELLGSAMAQVGGALVTYGIGTATGRPGLAELGRDLVRAQLLTQGMTQLVKRTVQRTRPDGSSRSSFPSGHASGTFATATVLQRHYGWKVGVPAYVVASYVAASRLSENKHFLSDVAFGAALGLAAGRTVTFDHGASRFEIAPMATAGGAGVQMTIFRR